MFVRRLTSISVFKILKNHEISEDLRKDFIEILEVNLDDFLMSSGLHIIIYSKVSQSYLIIISSKRTKTSDFCTRGSEKFAQIYLTTPNSKPPSY